MPANVIILTEGLAGSSVLAGLVANAGYWTGHETFKKKDYDTFENKRLIELNQRLFKEADFDGRYEMVYPTWAIEAIDKRAAELDPAPYREFIADCNAHAPWVWKDPRLVLTIRAWARWLDFDDIQLMWIGREMLQAWISLTLRRHIQTFEYKKFYAARVRDSVSDFLRLNELDCLRIVYEDLLLHPGQTMDRINAILGTTLDSDDLSGVYSGRLHRRHHGLANFMHALAIYLKNYGERCTLTIDRD